MSARLGTTQQIALEGFQSQLDDVLALHRNELHRRSETLFDDLNGRIRQSFEEASQSAVSQFDEQVRGLAEPHIERTNDAISRMAGGRSLLDASLSLQRDRIGARRMKLSRNRWRASGEPRQVEQLLRSITRRDGTQPDGLESRAGDIRHRTGGNLQNSGMVRKKYRRNLTA
jgi:hypothetical protein